MFALRWVIAGTAALMVGISIAIFRKQATAKSCPVHSRFAGLMATVLAWTLLIAGAGLIIFAWTLT